MSQKRKRKDPMSLEETMQRVIFHHYPTPSQFVRHAVQYFLNEFGRYLINYRPLRVLDHSAGTGVWNAIVAELIPYSYRVNVELQQHTPIREETAHEHHCGIRFQDYAESAPIPCDIILGNPPFKEAETFIHTSEKLLGMGGFALTLIPINFLSTQTRTVTLYRTWCPLRVIHIPKRLSFSKNGKTDEKEYVLLVHQKGYSPRFAQEDWWFDWSYDQPDIPEDRNFIPVTTHNPCKIQETLCQLFM